MTQRNILKPVHFASMIWFMLCLGYILVLALREAGINWWIVFSLSGHGTLFIFLLFSLYLFAIFRGVSRSQTVQVEHTLTSTNCYLTFYVLVPFLGGLAGYIGMIGSKTTISQFLLGIALGTLGTTFLVWVIVDPVTGMLEMLLPASRRHRANRLAKARIQYEKEREDREQLLTEVLARRESDQRRWRQLLKPEAEKLSELLTADRTDLEQVEQEVVDIGVNAWQMGKLICMQELHKMAMVLSKQKRGDREVIDYVSTWWDGIGNWHKPRLFKVK